MNAKAKAAKKNAKQQKAATDGARMNTDSFFTTED
jgi:hypothetical protein